MRDTFSILSQARADRLSSSIAADNIEACSSSSSQNFLISAVSIMALIFKIFPDFENLSDWIFLAAITRFLISADGSPSPRERKSSTGSADASTCMSILSSRGPEILAR